MFRFKEIALAALPLCLGATAAFAAQAAGGGSMPWDAPLTALQTDLTGTTATAVSLIAIVVVFGVLIFGGEMNHFGRSLCFIVLCASVLVAGQNILSALQITGATIDGETGQVVYGFIAGALITCLCFMFGLWARRKRIEGERRRAVSTSGLNEMANSYKTNS